MPSVHKSLRSPACLADQPGHQAAVATALHIWELHVGTVQLFIVGPGPDAWLACSKSYYSGQVGTDEERNIARRAVILLNREQMQTKDAGPAEITAALERARKLSDLLPSCEIAQPVAEPESPPAADVVPPPAVPPRQHSRVSAASPVSSKELARELERILASVSRHAAIPAAEILGKRKDVVTAQARFLSMAILFERLPRLTLCHAAKAFGSRHHGSVMNALARHRHLSETESAYQTLAALVREDLLPATTAA